MKTITELRHLVSQALVDADYREQARDAYLMPDAEFLTMLPAWTDLLHVVAPLAAAQICDVYPMIRG